MTDAEKLRWAVEEDTYFGDVAKLGPILVAEIKRLRDERDAIIALLVDTSAATTNRGEILHDALLPDGYSPLGFAWTQDYETRQEAVDAVRKAAGLAPQGEETP